MQIKRSAKFRTKNVLFLLSMITATKQRFLPVTPNRRTRKDHVSLSDYLAVSKDCYTFAP